MKKVTPKHIELVSKPIIFVWLLIYYSPNQSVVLVTRLQKSFFLFIKEFIVNEFREQKTLFEEEELFEGHNFGPYSRDIENAIAELITQNKILVDNKQMINGKEQMISKDLTNNFFDEDNYSDAIFTKNYKVFYLVKNHQNLLTINKIKDIFIECNADFDIFEKIYQ